LGINNNNNKYYFIEGFYFGAHVVTLHHETKKLIDPSALFIYEQIVRAGKIISQPNWFLSTTIR